MTIKDCAQLTPEELISSLQSSEKTGLSEHEAAGRLKKYGPNAVESTKFSWLSIMTRQIHTPFMYLLLFAAALSFFLQDKLNSAIIMLFVVISAVLGFYQEYYAERTILLLKKYLATTCNVLRGGSLVRISADQLVPGDIIDMEAGDIIPADLRFLDALHVWVDESTLTGESIPVHKTNEPTTAEQSGTTPPVIGLCGTVVSSGKARGIVIATGSKTSFGSISLLSRDIDRTSLFAKEISRFSNFMLLFVLTTIISIFLIHIAVKGSSISISQLALFAIALAVSIIPQGFPVVMTFALSYGARKLSKEHVVVKRLSAIEDLGSIDILCTDKTGTITENNLTIVQINSADENTLLLHAGLTCKQGQSVANQAANAFDRAIFAAQKPPQAQLQQTYTTEEEFPFDPIKRFSAVITQSPQERLLIMRGAAESVISYCSLDAPHAQEIAAWARSQGQQGNRVLAFASTVLDNNDKIATAQLQQIKNLELIGLLAFTDPVKKTAKQAIIKAQQLGLTVKIITGDAPEVAASVAQQVGLIQSTSGVMSGDQFAALSVPEQEEACKNVAVFARTSPEQKHLIIERLIKHGRVGFLGEGVNDAPALKRAHIGLAVNNSTEVAKEAADIVLLKKSLLVIVNGIEEGRRIFANTFKYIRGMTTSNFSNFYAIAFIALFIDHLPMLPLQILLVNLLSDFPLISIATDNVDTEELARPRIFNIRELALMVVCLGLISTCFDLIFFARFYATPPSVMRTNWFLYCVLSELAFFYSIRTKKFFLSAVAPSAQMVCLSLFGLIMTMTLPFINAGHAIFEFVTPTARQLSWTIGIVVAYFVCMEAAKLWYYWFFYNRKKVQ
jgi:Mg2+-importing ATPase